MQTTPLFNRIHFLQLLFSLVLVVSCSSASSTEKDYKNFDSEKQSFEKLSQEKQSQEKLCETRAPFNLAGKKVILQIENAVTQYPSGFPFKGAVLVNYAKDTWQAQGTATMQGNASPQDQYYEGNYQYFRTSWNSAIEKAFDTKIKAHYERKYIFETPDSGRWEENFDQGKIIFSGSFILVSQQQPIGHVDPAPSTNAGLHVALIIEDAVSTSLPDAAYPKRGLVLQTYASDGTLEFKGFGPGTLNSKGTYKYTKISPRTAVEETTQTSDFFTLPYTMVYTFNTPNSGVWFQNFGDGLIKFHGSFHTFPQ